MLSIFIAKCWIIIKKKFITKVNRFFIHQKIHEFGLLCNRKIVVFIILPLVTVFVIRATNILLKCKFCTSLRKFLNMYILSRLSSLLLIVLLLVKVFYTILRYTISFVLFINIIICKIIFFVYDLYSSWKIWKENHCNFSKR